MSIRVSDWNNNSSYLNFRVKATESNDEVIFYDGIEIEGGEMCGATVNSFDDHRVAMSFLIAGISAKEPITVLNTKNILTSFPDFYSLMKDAGVNIIRENN